MPINEDREAFLEELKEKKQLDEQARIAALQKLQEQGLGQKLVSKESQQDGRSLNVRRYGPYDLTTSLDTAHDPETNQKRGSIINDVEFRGGEHSESDMKKIAEEMREPGKPVEYDKWRGILKSLKPKTSSYVTSDQRSTKNQPLWYDEKE